MNSPSLAVHLCDSAVLHLKQKCVKLQFVLQLRHALTVCLLMISTPAHVFSANLLKSFQQLFNAPEPSSFVFAWLKPTPNSTAVFMHSCCIYKQTSIGSIETQIPLHYIIQPKMTCVSGFFKPHVCNFLLTVNIIALQRWEKQPCLAQFKLFVQIDMLINSMASLLHNDYKRPELPSPGDGMAAQKASGTRSSSVVLQKLCCHSVSA